MYLATVILDYLVPREAYSDVLRGLLYRCFDQNKCKLLFLLQVRLFIFTLRHSGFFSVITFLSHLQYFAHLQSEISFMVSDESINHRSFWKSGYANKTCSISYSTLKYFLFQEPSIVL
jgi:hypothetical protein